MLCVLGDAHWLSIQSPILAIQSLACVSQPCSGVWTGAQPAGVYQLSIGLTLEEGNILMPVIHKTLAHGAAKLDRVAYIGQSLSYCVVLHLKGTNCQLCMHVMPCRKSRAKAVKLFSFCTIVLAMRHSTWLYMMVPGCTVFTNFAELCKPA